MFKMSTESVGPPEQNPRARLGLAVAALVLGLASIALSIFVVGGLAGAVGLALALMHLFRRREQPRVMAVIGLFLSIFGVVASVGFGTLYYVVINDVVSSIALGGEAQKWVGAESPDFTVTTLDGQTFKLSDFRGRRVVVDYWATWCSPCIKEIPHFNKLRSAVPDDDLMMVGISSENESVLKPFLGKHKISYPIASVEDLPSPYSNVFVIPTTFFIDRNGVIQSVLVGYQNYDALKQHATASDYADEPKDAPNAPSKP